MPQYPPVFYLRRKQGLRKFFDNIYKDGLTGAEWNGRNMQLGRLKKRMLKQQELENNFKKEFGEWIKEE